MDITRKMQKIPKRKSHVENNTELIDGLFIFQPRVFEDERGSFFESFQHEKFCEAIGQEILFVQDNESISHKNVLRGLHFQLPPFAQGKLVRVIKGSVLDLAVDLRKNSHTYGQHFKLILSAENKKQLWIPAGFAHGFLALENETIFAYKCTNYYHPASEQTLLWNDESLTIEWECSAPIVSEKDQVGARFNEFISPF